MAVAPATLYTRPGQRHDLQQAAFMLAASADPDIIVDWEMPHHGEETGADCMKPGHRGHLANDGTMHAAPYIRDCGAWECPTCRSERGPTGTWVPRGYEKREALAIRDRIEAWRTTHHLSDFPVHPRQSGTRRRDKRQDSHPQAFHIVASPPQAWAERLIGRLSDYKVLKKHLHRVLKTRGVTGGAVIFHRHRIPGRLNNRSKCDAGPHFHILGATRWGDAYDATLCEHLYRGGEVQPRTAMYARLKETGAIPKRASGPVHVAGDRWIVRFFRGRIGSKRAPRDAYTTASYILSHASRPLHVRHATPPEAAESGYPASTRGTSVEATTYAAGALAVTWFGSMSYNRLKVPETDSAGHFCTICEKSVPQDEWHRLSWRPQDGDRPPPDKAQATDARDWYVFGGEGVTEGVHWEADRLAAIYRENPDLVYFNDQQVKP